MTKPTIDLTDHADHFTVADHCAILATHAKTIQRPLSDLHDTALEAAILCLQNRLIQTRTTYMNRWATEATMTAWRHLATFNAAELRRHANWIADYIDHLKDAEI